jgi:hypothetical protein
MGRYNSPPSLRACLQQTPRLTVQILVGRGVSLFDSYNGWLFSNGGHGPCKLEPDATVDSPPER